MSRFQPRPKALPTTSNVLQQNVSALAPNDPLGRSDTPLSRQSTRLPLLDPVSERATLILIRRTLCSSLGDKGRNTPAPIDALLPPLTSSNEVDLQLYALIAIIIKEFVQTWYSRITPDQSFVGEVVQIVAHCTRALEQRLRKVDLESLVFDELPDILEVHVQAYRIAHQPLHPKPIQQNSRQIYHALCPFPALAPVPEGENEQAVAEQSEAESAYRQLLVQGVLAVLLPTEDLENDCLSTLVGQIFSEMMLGGAVGGKVSEPWLLWEGITKIAEVIQTKLPQSEVAVRLDISDPASEPIPRVALGKRKSWDIERSIHKVFWQTLQYAFLIYTTLRFIIMTIATSSSLPARVVPSTRMTGLVGHGSALRPPKSLDTKDILQDEQPPFKRPIFRMKIWSCVSTILDIDARMPWLRATISLLQWGALNGPGKLGDLDGSLDKFLSHAIQTHVLDPTLLPQLLRTARSAIFPNNAPAPPRVPPTAADQLLIRERCAKTILSLIPAKVQDIYFGIGAERRVKEVEEVLDVFGDSYCNKHLLYGIVELIIVRLMPELAEKGVEELLAERLS